MLQLSKVSFNLQSGLVAGVLVATFRQAGDYGGGTTPTLATVTELR